MKAFNDFKHEIVVYYSWISCRCTTCIILPSERCTIRKIPTLHLCYSFSENWWIMSFPAWWACWDLGHVMCYISMIWVPYWLYTCTYKQIFCTANLLTANLSISHCSDAIICFSIMILYMRCVWTHSVVVTDNYI